MPPRDCTGVSKCKYWIEPTESNGRAKKIFFSDDVPDKKTTASKEQDPNRIERKSLN